MSISDFAKTYGEEVTKTMLGAHPKEAPRDVWRFSLLLGVVPIAARALSTFLETYPPAAPAKQYWKEKERAALFDIAKEMRYKIPKEEEEEEEKEKEKEKKEAAYDPFLPVGRAINVLSYAPLGVFAMAAAPIAGALLSKSFTEDIQKRYMRKQLGLSRQLYSEELADTLALAKLFNEGKLSLRDIRALPEEKRQAISDELYNMTGKSFAKELNLVKQGMLIPGLSQLLYGAALYPWLAWHYHTGLATYHALKGLSEKPTLGETMKKFQRSSGFGPSEQEVMTPSLAFFAEVDRRAEAIKSKKLQDIVDTDTREALSEERPTREPKEEEEESGEEVLERILRKKEVATRNLSKKQQQLAESLRGKESETIPKVLKRKGVQLIMRSE